MFSFLAQTRWAGFTKVALGRCTQEQSVALVRPIKQNGPCNWDCYLHSCSGPVAATTSKCVFLEASAKCPPDQELSSLCLSPCSAAATEKANSATEDGSCFRTRGKVVGNRVCKGHSRSFGLEFGFFKVLTIWLSSLRCG